MKAVGIIGVILSLVIVAMLYLKRSETVPDKVKETAKAIGMDPSKINQVQDISGQIQMDLNKKIKAAEDRNKKALEEIK